MAETSQMSGFPSGSALLSFRQVFFAHFGSPNVLALDGRNEGRGKPARSRSSKRFPASAQTADHGKQMRTVVAMKQCQDLPTLSESSRDAVLPSDRLVLSQD